MLPDLGWAYVRPLPWQREALAALGESFLALLRQAWPTSSGPPPVAGVRLTDVLFQVALHEALLATSEALFLFEGTEEEVSAVHVQQSERRLADFLASAGRVGFVWAYWATAAFTDYAALQHYGELSEASYLSGRRHRPWSEYRLTEILRVALDLGHVERIAGSPPLIRLTEVGRLTLGQLRELLRSSGVLGRWQLLGVLATQDEEVELAPEKEPFVSLRRVFVAEALASQPKRILEVGAGVGQLTYAGGLWEASRPMGQLWVADPSARRLAILRQGAGERPELKTVKASAEQLPFPDHHFDLVVGSLFLHLTDPPRAIAEMARVLRPGGHLALLFLTGTSLPGLLSGLASEHLGVLLRTQEETFWSLPTVEDLVNAQGLSLLEVETTTCSVRPEEPFRFLRDELLAFQRFRSEVPYQVYAEVLAEVAEHLAGTGLDALELHVARLIARKSA